MSRMYIMAKMKEEEEEKEEEGEEEEEEQQGMKRGSDKEGE